MSLEKVFCAPYTSGAPLHSYHNIVRVTVIFILVTSFLWIFYLSYLWLVF